MHCSYVAKPNVKCGSSSAHQPRVVSSAPPPPGAELAGSLMPDGACRNRFLNLLLNGGHSEANAPLHPWKVNQRLLRSTDDLLNEHKTPEFEDKPIIICDRAIILAIEHASALIRIEP